MSSRPDLATLELWLENMAKEDPIYQQSCYEAILFATKERQRLREKDKKRRAIQKEARKAKREAARNAPGPNSEI